MALCPLLALCRHSQRAILSILDVRSTPKADVSSGLFPVKVIANKTNRIVSYSGNGHYKQKPNPKITNLTTILLSIGWYMECSENGWYPGGGVNAFWISTRTIDFYTRRFYKTLSWGTGGGIDYK